MNEKGGKNTDKGEAAGLLEEINGLLLAAIKDRLANAATLSVGDLKSLAGIVKDMGGSGDGSPAPLIVRFQGEADEFSM